MEGTTPAPTVTPFPSVDVGSEWTAGLFVVLGALISFVGTTLGAVIVERSKVRREKRLYLYETAIPAARSAERQATDRVHGARDWELVVVMGEIAVIDRLTNLLTRSERRRANALKVANDERREGWHPTGTDAHGNPDWSNEIITADKHRSEQFRARLRELEAVVERKLRRWWSF